MSRRYSLFLCLLYLLSRFCTPWGTVVGQLDKPHLGHHPRETRIMPIALQNPPCPRYPNCSVVRKIPSSPFPGVFNNFENCVVLFDSTNSTPFSILIIPTSNHHLIDLLDSPFQREMSSLYPSLCNLCARVYKFFKSRIIFGFFVTTASHYQIWWTT